jgi:glucose-1-phosphate adenylyltransferase
MKDFHGIIFAYSTAPELRELVSVRTSASLPFCGRYRLIDFSLSSMRNAGILDVGVIMQRDYQSLLNHLAGGKPWDMSRRSGGMQILPPFGLPEYHRGNYAGTMEALNAVSSYIKDISAKYIVLMLGNTCANLDLSAPMKQHVASGAEITAICAKGNPDGSRIAYAVDAEGYVTEMLMDTEAEEGELASLEAYIINKETLLKMMNFALKRNLYRFACRKVFVKRVITVFLHCYAAHFHFVTPSRLSNMQGKGAIVLYGNFYFAVREIISL